MALTLLQIGIIYFLGHLFSFTFKRYKVPDVLLFIIIGLVLGPILKLVQPTDFGSSGPVLSTLALVVILFESGTTLDMRSLAQILGAGLTLTTTTFLITGVAAFALSYPFTLSWHLSLLTGVILAGTAAAVVIPMASALGLSEKPKNILILESALTDVLCIILTLALTKILHDGPVAASSVVKDIFLSFVVALIMGALSGAAWVFLKDKFQAQFATIAYAIFIYAAVELLGFSGPIAVMSLGVALANTHKLHEIAAGKALSNTELDFYMEIVFVLKTFFFIFLGISMHVENWWVLPVAAVFVTIIILTRKISSRLILRKLEISPEENTYIDLLIPKGLAAAVLASVPQQAGLEGAEKITQFVYPSVLVSIVIVSLLIPYMGRRFSPGPGPL